MDFANRAIAAGYRVPNNFMIDAIKDRDEDLIKKLLEQQIYNKDNLEVEFWFLLHEGFYSFAAKLHSNESILNEFVGGFNY
jgi:hypothetical protein